MTNSASAITAAGDAPFAWPTPSVLVVDDEPGYREGIRRVLSARGFAVRAVATGREAIELIGAADFSIALVDLKMPEMDGFEVLARVRATKPATLCIIVSAFATIESAVQTTKMGAFDFVVKPFMADDLMVVVNRAVETWRLTSERERLRAERESHLLELAAEKSRLRTIIQSIAEGILVVNVDGDIVLDNPLTRRLLGCVHTPRLEGKVENHLADPRFLAEIRRMLDGEAAEVGVVMELAVATPAGEDQRYARATLAPIRDERGSVLGVVVLLADITKSKAFERMKSLFVSMVAHELKAPLGAVEGYLHLVRDGSFDEAPERQREVVDRCLERTGALIELIQDLLEISRRNLTQPDRRIEPLDPVALCSAMVDFHRNEADKRGLAITVEAAPLGVPLYADRGDLERMLTNLVSNAIKYNREGGSISVRVRPSGGLVVLEVEDTGLGMTTDDMKRLGEEFYRVKNAQTRHIAGTGLGIALVKKILDSYGGVLEVESSPGKGSTFRVVLPIGERVSTFPPPSEKA